MRIGIDLGGTKIEGIVIDDAGSELHRLRQPTPVNDGYFAVIDTIVSMVSKLEATLNKNCKIGVGTPGAISSRTGCLKNANTASLNGKQIKEDLEYRLNREIKIENDANCFTLSEAIDGAAQDYGVVFGVIMGTGVGGGIVFRKTLHVGPQHIAGEWGHNILVPDGRRCSCGKQGCVETYLSGSGLTYDWRTDQSIDAKQLVAKADAGDVLAENIVKMFLERFGQALANVINILDPDAIVVGGGLSNIQRLYTEGWKQVRRFVFNDELRTVLLRNRHGDSSGVRGAAQLWPVS